MRAARTIVAALGCSGLGACSLFLDTDGLDEGTASPATSSSSDGSTDGASSSSSGSDGPQSIVPSDDGGASSSGGQDSSLPLPRLVGDWSFNEGSGTAINDISGRSHNGLLLGTGAWVADSKDAGANAFEFKSDDDYVLVGGSPDFDRRPGDLSKLSLTVWMRTADNPDHDMFFSISYGNTEESYGIELRTPTVLSYWDSKTHIAESNIPNVASSGWHHYAIAVDGNQARIYFDGIRVGSADNADTTPRSSKQLLFGRSSFGDRLHGAIDKARFFRVALTDAEVLAEKNR